MDMQDTGAQTNATEAAESVTGGEVSIETSTEVTGESGETASSEKGTTGTEGLFDGMDAPTLHKSYKSLQGEFTKVSQAIKKLERFGGPDQITQWADYLSNNPRFAEWVQKEQMAKTTGVDEAEMDETTKKAYETVRKIADASTDQKVKAILQNEIAPLAEAYKQQLLDSHFSEMDKKYGADWHELRDKMSELSADLPTKVQNKPAFKDVESLFVRALVETGKFDTFAAKQYQKKLTDKKAKATDRPGSALPSAPKQFKSIQEAYAAAKAQMG